MYKPFNKLNMSDNRDEDDSKKNKGFGPQKPDGDFDWSKILKSVFSWGAVIIAAVIVMQFLNAGQGEAVEVDYDNYEKLLNDNKIKTITVIKSEINNYVIEAELVGDESIPVGKTSILTDKISVIVIEKIIEQQQPIWKEKQIKYNFTLDSNEWFTVLISFLPWILMIGIWILIMRRMQGGSGTGGSRGIFNFGKSRAKLSSQSSIKVTFKDVAGADEAKQELEEIIEFLKEPTKFQKLGGKIPRGVLLLGPPGTGKTLMARAVAGEAGVPFYSISGADFVEMFVGVGASRVRDLFEQGKKNAPCIIFIDEIDAVGRHRGAGLGGGHDESEQTLNHY